MLALFSLPLYSYIFLFTQIHAEDISVKITALVKTSTEFVHAMLDLSLTITRIAFVSLFPFFN